MMKAVSSLVFLSVLSSSIGAQAAAMSPKEKCVKISEMIYKTDDSQASIQNFMQEFDHLSGEEQKSILTANTQRIYLRLKYFEKLAEVKADEKVMKTSGDILNDVIVGDVYTDAQAIEKLKAQLAPLNEQMLLLSKKLKDSGFSGKCDN